MLSDIYIRPRGQLEAPPPGSSRQAAYRASQYGLSFYQQFFTTENVYLLINAFYKKRTLINIGEKKVVGVR